MPIPRSKFLRFLLPLALAALGAILCAILVPAETLAVKQQLSDFPDSDVQAQQLRPMILAGLCFLPALAGLIYCFGCTMDRYISREFARIFGICVGALFVIWLLLDLSDNMSEFRESSDVFLTIIKFYTTRSPAILLMLLPYSLLLSLLYALGKLSGNREITAMIQSGRGILRITLPLIIIGIFFSVLSLGLNYHWGPVAAGTGEDIFASASGRSKVKAESNDQKSKESTAATESNEQKSKESTSATNVLYRNPRSGRLWMIGAFPKNYQMGEPLLKVEVTTTDDDERLISRLTAARAFWDRDTREWTFEEPTLCHYKLGKPAEFEKLSGPIKETDWSETPWQLIKPGLSAAVLGIPDLNSWLQDNSKNARFADPAPYLTQWHYRWAMPFTCLVSVLLATPLAVHFSRRGAGGGIFLAVILSALMVLLSNISMALGEAGTFRPLEAAWLPNIVFTLLGVYLFHRRIAGRQIYFYLRRFLPGND